LDRDGHGTLVASIAIGAMHGVAKGANAIAVKVIQQNIGSLSDSISGIEWSVRAAVSSRRPSIINFGLDGPPSQALRMAALAGIRAGVHFTAGAGDVRTNAGNGFVGSCE
jgi:subtilisin family serine protease